MSSEPSVETGDPDNTSTRQRKARRRKQRAREHALWAHALERLRERCDPEATMADLRALAIVAAQLHRNHIAGVRPVKYAGGVLRVDGIEAVVVRCPYGSGWVKVVLSPMDGVLRTVLP